MPEARTILVIEPPSSIPLPEAPLVVRGAGIEGAGSERSAARVTTDVHEELRRGGRMRALLRASAAVASELNLAILLRHIVVAARDLVDAGYAALAVTARDGSMAQWVHVGIDERTASEVDHLSRERHALEMLIDGSDLYSVPDLRTRSGAVGRHADIAPTVRFLAVPICVRNQVFATLYATENAHGGFADEDLQLITSLACSAGVAVEHVRLYEQSEQSRRWQRASIDATQQLFATEIGRPLDVVLRFAALGADADVALLMMVTDDDHMAIRATYGSSAENLTGRTVALAGSAIGAVFRSEKSALISHPVDRQDTDRQDPVARLIPGIGSLIAAPFLMNHRQAVGVVIVGGARGRRALDMADVDQLTTFAGNVSVALQLDDARAEREAVRLRSDHDRIASDMNAHVVQGLLATGMGLQGLVHGLDRPEYQARVLEYVDAIDAVICRIRATIFDLHPGDRAVAGL